MNHKAKLTSLAVGIAAIFLVTATVITSDAQPKSEEKAASAGGGGFGFGYGGAGFGGGGSPQAMARLLGTGAIAANAEYIYVLRDTQLTQFSAADLKLIKTVSVLPSDESEPEAEAAQKK